MPSARWMHLIRRLTAERLADAVTWSDYQMNGTELRYGKKVLGAHCMAKSWTAWQAAARGSSWGSMQRCWAAGACQGARRPGALQAKIGCLAD